MIFEDEQAGTFNKEKALLEGPPPGTVKLREGVLTALTSSHLSSSPVGDTNIPDPIMVPTMREIPLNRPTVRFRFTLDWLLCLVSNTLLVSRYRPE